ncbi:DUF4270 family protein [Flavobacteriaceae bacterium F89]|uniref:DUF4270 family protein n=1 Tax=Cerina litoralis TaxID=2874477 RepID=A0AAE3JPZ2_9FLAO|nr:DUF4270 family protein [Cerina litoralis]MCG2461551.1 DUF4270 family protein [Cerina litoralis]
MNLSKSAFFPAIVGLFVMLCLFSCDEDVITIGEGAVGGKPFDTGKAVYDVFAYNKNIKAVKTNKLPVYQLGVFNDPIYGKTQALVTSQVQLSSVNPRFGIYSQQSEDNADTDANASTIQENEKVTDVYLYIPYLRAEALQRDPDNDGVDSEYDADPNDPNSDSDGDGLTDIQEKSMGSNPLNKDTDGDGIEDGLDTDIQANTYAKKFQLDSIYGIEEKDYPTTPFHLKVERSTYYLRDLDPDSNFMQAQEYYSSQQFSPEFVSDVLFDGEEYIRNEETLTFKEDDPNTPEVDESKQVDTRTDPGIYVKLDPAFFQTNILDKEGSSELLSQDNFKDFFRGIHLSISPISGEEMMILFDLKKAYITINYEYDKAVSGSTEKANSSYRLNFLTQQVSASGVPGIVSGNAVNTYNNETYPSQVADQLDTGENASRLYVKGGAGSFSEIKLFDADNGEGILDDIRKKNWVINEANLVFYVDRNTLDAAGGTTEPSRIYLYDPRTNQPLYSTRFDAAGETSLSSYPMYGGVLEKSAGKGEKYSIRITNYINDLIVGDSTNVTLALSVTSEIRNPLLSNAKLTNGEENVPIMSNINPLGTVLYGSNVPADEADKKLQLVIFYTEIK